MQIFIPIITEAYPLSTAVEKGTKMHVGSTKHSLYFVHKIIRVFLINKYKQTFKIKLGKVIPSIGMRPILNSSPKP